jgi:hypothetical protein
MRSKFKLRIYIFVTGIAGFMIILSYLSMANSYGPGIVPGAQMPALEILCETGLRQLEPSPEKYKLVVLFSDECNICVAQIDDLNANYAIPPRLDLVFVTTDVNFLINRKAAGWPKLNTANQISFGIIKRRSFLEAFGSLITPSYYLFDQKGELVWMAKGKVAFEVINMIMLRSRSE